MGSSGEIKAIENMADLLDRLQRPLGEQGVEEVRRFIGVLVQPEQVGNCLYSLLRHSTNTAVIDCALGRLGQIYNPHRHEAWVTALANVAEQLWKEGRYLETDGQPGWLPRLYTLALSRRCQDQRSQRRLLDLYDELAPSGTSRDYFGIRLISARVAGDLQRSEESFS